MDTLTLTRADGSTLTAELPDGLVDRFDQWAASKTPAYADALAVMVTAIKNADLQMVQPQLENALRAKVFEAYQADEAVAATVDAKVSEIAAVKAAAGIKQPAPEALKTDGGQG
jgi:hypothetical protein